MTRRAVVSAAAAMAASQALAQRCRIGPAPHHKGAPVFLDYDQVELGAAYDQVSYEPLMPRCRSASPAPARRCEHASAPPRSL